MNILTMQPTPPTRNDDWQGWIRYGLQWAALGSAASAPARDRAASDTRACPDPWGERWEGHASPRWTAADASAPARYLLLAPSRWGSLATDPGMTLCPCCP